MLEFICGKVGVSAPVPVGSRLSRMSIGCAHRLRPLAASVPVPDAGNALGPKDMAGELIDDQLVNGTKMLTLEIVDGGPVDFLR